MKPKTAIPKLDKYTSMGCYPLFYADLKEAETLCADCASASENRDQLQVEVNWEDPDMYCDACSARIESAYADSETEETEEEVSL